MSKMNAARWIEEFLRLAPDPWLRAQLDGELPAATLLWQHLDERQRDDLLRLGYFQVRGGTTKSIYFIYLNGDVSGTEVTAYNRMRLRFADWGGGEYHTYCCYAPGDYPMGDRILMHKWSLEADEPGWLAIAH